MIEFRQLRQFLAVVEEGGIRQAARHIHLSASSVARSVQMLEEHYGVSLLSRGGKTLEPTAFGAHLAEEARAIVAGFEGIESRLGQIADLSAGVLRLGISPATADLLLPNVAARLLVEHPGVRVETQLGHVSEMLPWLTRREIDLIVGYERPLAMQGDLKIVPLHQDQGLWWVRSGHPLASRQGVTPGDLVDYPVICQFLPSPYRSWFADFCLAAAAERPGCRVNLAHQCSDYSVLIRIALQCDAVLLATSRNVLSSPHRDRFARLNLDEAIGEYNVSAAWLRAAPPSPLAERFVELLQDEAERTIR